MAKLPFISMWLLLDWDRSAMLELNECTEPETDRVSGLLYLLGSKPERALEAVSVPVCHDLVPATSLHVSRLGSFAGVYENSESMSMLETSPPTDIARWNCSDRSIPPPSFLRRLPLVDSVSSQSPYEIRIAKLRDPDRTHSTRGCVVGRARRGPVVWVAAT